MADIIVTPGSPTVVTITPPTVSPVIITAGGPKGDTGATGPTGPQGPAGADGNNLGNTDQTIAASGVRDIEMGLNNLTFSSSDTVVHTISPTSGVTFNRGITVTGTSAASATITLREDTDNGTNFVRLAAPSDIGSNLILALPSADGSDGHFLKTDGAGTLSFAADNNTTFSVSCVDGDNSDEEKIRLTGSDGSTDDVVLEAGTGLSIARSSDKITFTNTVSDTNTQLSDEQVQDIVGAMFSSNTETRISATYQDADGTIDLVVDDMNSTARSLTVACSDETSDLTTGTAKATFRMPQAATITAVRASVTTAPAGSALTVDINESGSTILSTKLTIDAGEKTSTTAATAAVISDASIADDAEMTIDIDAIGSSTAGAGLKVTIYYNPA
jgi:hypothetical protein